MPLSYPIRSSCTTLLPSLPKGGGNYSLRTRYKKSLSRREAINRNIAFEKEVEKEEERCRGRDRETVLETDKQTGKQTDSQTDRQTESNYI